MCKFCEREEVGLVVLLVVAEYLEVLFYFLVDPFGFAVGLGVEGRTKGGLDVEFLP